MSLHRGDLDYIPEVGRGKRAWEGDQNRAREPIRTFEMKKKKRTLHGRFVLLLLFRHCPEFKRISREGWVRLGGVHLAYAIRNSRGTKSEEVRVGAEKGEKFATAHPVLKKTANDCGPTS